MTSDASEKGLSREEKEEMEQAIENTKPLMNLATSMVDAAIADAARESGRTPERQLERMGDHFAYQAAEMDPDQKQLDDYEIRGETVEVVP